SAFSWTILFHHDTHIHPAGTLAGASSGSLAIPATGHSFAGSTSYEIVLTVTDSDGLKGRDSVFIYPEKVNLSFATSPSGLGIEIDGIRQTAPFVLDDAKNFTHVINAPAQGSNGTAYVFQSWSDHGAASHSIAVPIQNQSFLATFQPGPAGLVAAYAFEEGSGTNAIDASGNDNKGVLAGATRTTSGKIGSALVFDGTSAMVNIAQSPSLDLSTAMTLEAWVYPTTLGGWRDIIYRANDSYYLSGSGGGEPAVGATFAGTNSNLFGPGALPLNAWSHVAATYDGATVRLYVGGNQVASRSQTGSIPASSYPLTLGGDPVYSQFWAGSIDEVRVYNRALSAAEIQADMNLPEPHALAQQIAGAIAALGLGARRKRRSQASASASTN